MSGERRRELELQLSAYLDDELGPEQRREIDALLKADTDARALLKELQATANAVKGLPRAKASDRLLESLRARAERDSLPAKGPAEAKGKVGSRGRFYGRWLAVAAGLGLIVTTGYVTWPKVRERMSRPGTQLAMREGRHTEAGRQKSLEKGMEAEEGVESRSDNRRELADKKTPEGERAAEKAKEGKKGDSRSLAEAPAEKISPVDRPLAFGMAGKDKEQGGQTLVDGNAMKDEAGQVAAAPLASPVAGVPSQSQAVAGLDSMTARAQFKQVPQAGVTVLELAYADSLHQSESISKLADADGFGRAGFESANRSSTQMGSLAVSVPDQAAAERFVSELGRSLKPGDKAQVLNPATPQDHELALVLADASLSRGDGEGIHASAGKGASAAAAAKPVSRRAGGRRSASGEIDGDHQNALGAPDEAPSPAQAPPGPRAARKAERRAGYEDSRLFSGPVGGSRPVAGSPLPAPSAPAAVGQRQATGQPAQPARPPRETTGRGTRAFRAEEARRETPRALRERTTRPAEVASDLRGRLAGVGVNHDRSRVIAGPAGAGLAKQVASQPASEPVPSVVRLYLYVTGVSTQPAIAATQPATSSEQPAR